MADLGTALIARLLADAGVAAIVAARTYWVAAPQGVAVPYLVLSTISDVRVRALPGATGRRQPRVQADCMGATYAQARALAAAVEAAVAEPATVGGAVFGLGEAEGPRDLDVDPAGGHLFNASVDLLLDYRMED